LHHPIWLKTREEPGWLPLEMSTLRWVSKELNLG
jgi:hypothetical protein